MNKRSKSELILQLNQEKTQKQDLMDKIQRSKPVLITIYDKFHKKQKILKDRINKNVKNVAEFKNIAHQYKKLYEESILIMNKSKTIQKFNGSLSNYMIDRGKLTIKNDKQNTKSMSVYQEYKERITKEINNSKQQKNPEIQNLRKKNQQLKKQIINQIDKHKMIRDKSQKALSKSKSSYQFKPVKSSDSDLDETDYKKRLVQRQQRRLARIRQ